MLRTTPPKKQVCYRLTRATLARIETLAHDHARSRESIVEEGVRLLFDRWYPTAPESRETAP